MLARARERVPGGVFVEADVTRPWPLPDASADAVLVDLVLEHVADLDPVMREAARVLRPGGRLRICELHPDRQRAGAQARFVEDGDEIRVPAFLHPADAFLAAATDFSVARRDDDAAPGDATPRLLTVVLVRR
jgi:malonyl-CoA O-methyltransferase